MNYDSRHTDLVRIYGTEYIDKRMPGYYPILKQAEKIAPPVKATIILEKAKEHLLKKSGIDSVIRELTFAIFALGIFIYMQASGRLILLAGFGAFVGASLLFATAYNLFKASLKSLAPGIVCFAGSLFLLITGIHQSLFLWITDEHLNYIVGIGAIFIALSLIFSRDD